MKCSYGIVLSYSSKEKWPVFYLSCNNYLISLGKRPDVSTLLATFMPVFHKIMLFLSYTLSGKCVCFFFSPANLSQDAYLHFHHLISLYWGGVGQQICQPVFVLWQSLSVEHLAWLYSSRCAANEYLNRGPRATIPPFLEPEIRKRLRQEKDELSRQLHQTTAIMSTWLLLPCHGLSPHIPTASCVSH